MAIWNMETPEFELRNAGFGVTECDAVVVVSVGCEADVPDGVMCLAPPAESTARPRAHLRARQVAAKSALTQLQRQLYHFAQMAKGNSKGLAGQFVFRPDAADNAARRASVHHWGAGGGGSHYNMAAAAGRSKGTSKGLLSRHSKQGARLQAARNMSRARDAAKGQMGVRNNAQKTGGGQGGRNKSKGNSKGE